MSQWFRFYEGALDDPKVQTLPDADFKLWVNILCVACRNDGVLPAIAPLAFLLRISENDCRTLVERLVNGGLINRKNGGANGMHHAPHAWDKRQYKSDNSSARVKRYRDRSAAATGTPPDTDTDTDTDTERKKKKEGSADAPTTGFAFVGRVIRLNQADFDQWRKSYNRIPDMMAELQKADDYYAENPPKGGKWFPSVSRWLSKAHEDARKPIAARDADTYRNVL